MPEAQLAKELDLPFIAIAMVTDYDAWKVDTEPASVAEIIKACFIFGFSSLLSTSCKLSFW